MGASSENVQSLLLDEILDISSVTELKARFLNILENKTSVSVDARNVGRVDTAVLQVMAAFVQDAKTQEQSVQWQEPSVAFSQSADLLGLRDVLGLDGHSA